MDREHLFLLNFLMKGICILLLGLTTNSVVVLCLIAVLGWLFGSTVILFIGSFFFRREIVSSGVIFGEKGRAKNMTYCNTYIADILRERLTLQYLAHASGWYFFCGGLLGLTRPAAIGACETSTILLLNLDYQASTFFFSRLFLIVKMVRVD